MFFPNYNLVFSFADEHKLAKVKKKTKKKSKVFFMIVPIERKQKKKLAKIKKTPSKQIITVERGKKNKNKSIKICCVETFKIS